MRMRQSLADFEHAFVTEAELDRDRRERLRRDAATRARQRRAERIQRRGNVRFVLLVLSMILTAVLVTVVMFETLYLVMG